MRQAHLLSILCFVASAASECEGDSSCAAEKDTAALLQSSVNLLQSSVKIHQVFASVSDQAEVHKDAANNLAAGSKILIIGDSNAAFAGPYPEAGILTNTLQEACSGSTVVNKGDPGTKVSAWMAHGLLANAVNSGTGWTHVWLSIGGNDLSEDYGCGPKGSKKNAIKADITKLIAETKKLTTAKIILTSYAVTAADDTCSLADVHDNVAKAMEEIATTDPKVTYAPIATAASGILDPKERASKNCDESVLGAATASPKIGIPPCRGDKQFFMTDFIHLNAKGYAAAWALPSVQKAFGCLSGNTPVAPVAPVPPAPPAPPATTCVDNDAAVAPASDGAFNTCAELIASPYNCKHAQYGAQIKALCSLSCKCSAPLCCAVAQSGI